MKVEFSNNEKIDFFNKISNRYFNRNFGSMSKGDLETLIFSEYIEHCLRNGLEIDDYTISKELGITQNRVRTFKERKELKYPYNEFDWRTALETAILNAKYDSENRKIKMVIQDVNVMIELRHYIEEKGWYDEVSLNTKLFQIPLDCFLEIFMDLENITGFSKKTKDKIKELGLKDNATIKFLKDFTKEGLKEFIRTASKKTMYKVISLIPVIGEIVSNLIK